jgi:hypothetical protein
LNLALFGDSILLIRAHCVGGLSALDTPDKRKQVLVPDRGEELLYPWNTQDQKDQYYQPINQWSYDFALQLKDVTLFG